MVVAAGIWAVRVVVATDSLVVTGPRSEKKTFVSDLSAGGR